MHTLLLIALSKYPSIVAPFKLKRKVPANPAMVIVFPTNDVEGEMVHKYNDSAFSLLILFKGARVSTTRAYHSSHKHESDFGSSRQVRKTAREDVAIRCLSPEQLISKGFADLPVFL